MVRTFKMEIHSVNVKNDDSESLPAKKIKLNTDNVIKSVSTRTVATLCGPWRRDELDGGLVFVFKTRDPGLSPDPLKEEEMPENSEDFWVPSLESFNDIQVSFYKFALSSFSVDSDIIFVCIV